MALQDSTVSKAFFWILISALAIASIGCSPPIIDGTSDESMKSSVEKMTKGMSPEEAKKFSEAMTIVMLSSAGSSLSEMASNPNAAVERARLAVNGKTAADVIAEAERIRIEREARERSQALKEIQELQTRKQAADLDRDALTAFEVLDARFSKEQDTYTTKPIIYLHVRNGTGHAISRAYFKGTLATPGRSIPWLSEVFNYEIPGGLEPNEDGIWNLAPNMFSPWGQVEMRDDMLLTVEVTKLDGPDGETLFNSEWSETDETRLQALTSKFQP